MSSKKVHKLLLVEKEIEQDQVLVEDSSSLLSDNINESEPTDNDTDSKNKIIIDENSTDNQFKLELKFKLIISTIFVNDNFIFRICIIICWFRFIYVIR